MLYYIQEITLKAHEAYLNESQRLQGKRENPPTAIVPKSEKRAPIDDGLEWWERQGKDSDRIRLRSSTLPAQNRATVPQSAAVRNPTPANRPITPPPSEAWASAPQQPINDIEALEAPESPPAVRNFKPRSGAIRNEGVMRQLSAMRERLNKEQNRVQSALYRRDYNEGVFDGDTDAIPPVDAMLRQQDELDSYVSEKGIRLDRDLRRQYIKLREHSDFEIHKSSDQRGSYYPPPSENSPQAYFDRYGRPVIPHSNGKVELNGGSSDDPPLVRMIKNSRTSLQSAYPPLRETNPYPSQPYGTNRPPRYKRLNRSMSIETLDADNPQRVVDDYLHRRDLKPRKDRRLFDRSDSSDSLYR